MKTEKSIHGSITAGIIRLVMIAVLSSGIGNNLARAEPVFTDSSEFALDLPADLFIGVYGDSGDFALDLAAELYIGSLADSDDFDLNLAAELYIGSTGDSEPFAMNLYPVYRTSSDSGNFRLWPLFGDINNDSRVDLSDLSMISAYWLRTCNPPDFCDGVDTGPDGIINIHDIIDLAQFWGQSWNVTSFEIEGVEIGDPVWIVKGPGVRIDRIEGFNAAGLHQDSPGIGMEDPLIIETSAWDAKAVSEYFQAYLSNPKETPIRAMSLIVHTQERQEWRRWNFYGFAPYSQQVGEEGRTRFTFQVQDLSVLQWEMDGGDFGDEEVYNPKKDRKVEISGVCEFYPEVVVDRDRRTLTMTYESTEGEGLYPWVKSQVNGTVAKHDLSMVSLNAQLQETSRENYYGCFTIGYEIVEGYSLDNTLRARIVLSYDFSEIAGGGRLPQGNVILPRLASYEWVQFDGEQLFQGLVWVVKGPGVRIDRIEGYGPGGQHQDSPGKGVEDPLIIETSGSDAAVLSDYFQEYLANPEETPIRSLALIVNALDGQEWRRWIYFESAVPDQQQAGDQGRTRFTFRIRELPGLQWVMDGGDFGKEGSYNPTKDLQVEISGVCEFYPEVVVDRQRRTLTMTYEDTEGKGLYPWVKSQVQGAVDKHELSMVYRDAHLQETHRENYFGCFPVSYEIMEGYCLNDTVRARIVLSYDLSENADEGGGRLPQGNVTLPWLASYNWAQFDGEQLFQGPVWVVSGPGVWIDRIEGYNTAGLHQDTPGKERENPLVIEASGSDAMVLSEYFQMYLTNPDETPIRAISLIVPSQGGPEWGRFNFYEFAPVQQQAGDNGRTQFHFQVRDLPQLQWEMAGLEGDCFGQQSSFNPTKDRKVEIIGVCEFYPEVEVDRGRRILKMTYESTEGKGLFPWVRRQVNGAVEKHNLSLIFLDSQLRETHRENYYGCFPVSYQIMEGYSISRSLKAQIILSYDLSENADEGGGILPQGNDSLYFMSLYSWAQFEGEQLLFQGQVWVVKGPGIQIDRIMGYGPGGQHQDLPGKGREDPLIIEASGSDAAALSEYFQEYTANPSEINIRALSLIVPTHEGVEWKRWNFIGFAPYYQQPGNLLQTRFTFRVRGDVQGLQWQMDEGDFGDEGSYNPTRDLKVEISGVSIFYPEVVLDHQRRTLTMTYASTEGKGLYQWIKSIVQGVKEKHDLSVIHLDARLQEMKRENYFGCFPIGYEIGKGFSLDRTIRARIILSFDKTEDASGQ